MKMIVKFILFAFLISSTLSECNEGCIVCRSNDRCLICDFINAYYLSNNSCIKDTGGNCRLYQLNTSNGRCLLCNDGFFLDSEQKCVEVTTEVDNCRSYASNNVCRQCEPGFILSGNECVEVTNIIPNCQSYASTTATTCLECEPNYIRSIDGTRCNFNPSIRNCANFSHIQCLACTTGTTLHQNVYIDEFRNAITNSSSSSLNNRLFDLMRGSIDQVAFTKCRPTDGTNCSRFNSIGVCQLCDEGYFLNNSKECISNPVQPIPSCAVYATLTRCGICEDGFHLDDSENCIANEVIEDCTTYDSSATTTTCTACAETHYLQDNSCVTRTNAEIENCSTFSVTQDRCEACTSGNQLTSDGLRCLEPVENCATYSTSDSTSESLICSVCEDTYYLDQSENACVLGTVEDCLKYETTSDVCQECREGFYLSDSACSQRTATVTNCEIYTRDVDGRCDTCSNSSVLFSLNRGCKSIESIEECATYQEYNICSSCNDGFYLSDNACLAIPEEENCLQKDNDLCTLCKEGYYLENGTCFIIPDISTSECATQEDNPTSPIVCRGCNNNFVPFVYTDKYLCRNADTLNGTLIPNCTRYKTDNSTLTCTRCQDSHVVASDGLSCVLSCSSNETILVGELSFAEEDTHAGVTLESYKRCYNVENEEELEGCEIASVALNAPGNKKICLKCKSDFIPIQTCPVEVGYFDPANIGGGDLGSSYIAIECVQNENASYAPANSSTPVSNCAYYITDGDNNYYCKKCAFGYTSTIQVENEISFLTCDEEVAGCNAEVKFGGALANTEWVEEMFGFNISHAYSCHKCTDENEIPFLHQNYHNELLPYGIAADVPSTADNFDGHHLTCRTPDADGLQMSAEQFTAFPDNCALGLYVVDKSKGSNIELGTTALCLACKNGFKPVFDDDAFIIAECEAISNCDTSVEDEGWFNSCKTCAEGHVYQYDVDNKLLKTNTCIETTHQNCLAIRSDNAQCSICSKNAVLNYDGVCEALKPDACTEYTDLNENSFNSSETFNNLNLAYYYLLNEGCAACNDDRVIVRDSRTLQSCVFSSYIQAADFPSETKYIANCSSYYYSEGDLLCRTCASDYIPNNGDSLCSPQNDFSNCAVTNEDASECETCDSSTTKVESNCVQRSIANCATYAEGSSVLTCQGCAAGFILQDNECLAGTVDNCTIYDQSTRLCTTCEGGHILVTRSGAGQQCMQMPSALNCEVAALNEDNDELICNACGEGFGFTFDSDDFNDNTCVQVNLIDDCSTYDIRSDLSASTFSCTLCDELFYLRDRVCVSRNVVSGCRAYNPTEDKCTACESGFFLDDNGACKAFTVGIRNCEVYANEDTCTRCVAGYFLSQNSCNAVPSDNLIEECHRYSGESTCASCNRGFVLTENACVEAVAQNCAAFTDVRTCSSCDAGFYLSLNTDTQVTSCIEGNLANCEQISPIEPLSCLRCSGAFVVGDERTCVPVTTAILNCESYEDSTQLCRTCAPGFILSTDRQSCIEFDSPPELEKCAALRYMERPICTVCNAGYFFDESICVRCATQNYQTGCLYCDYADQSRCLICRSGFSQNTEGNCVINPSLVMAFENEAIEHVSLLSSLAVLLLGLLSIKD